MRCYRDPRSPAPSPADDRHEFRVAINDAVRQPALADALLATRMRTAPRGPSAACEHGRRVGVAIGTSHYSAGCALGTWSGNSPWWPHRLSAWPWGWGSCTRIGSSPGGSLTSSSRLPPSLSLKSILGRSQFISVLLLFSSVQSKRGPSVGSKPLRSRQCLGNKAPTRLLDADRFRGPYQCRRRAGSVNVARLLYAQRALLRRVDGTTQHWYSKAADAITAARLCGTSSGFHLRCNIRSHPGIARRLHQHHPHNIR